MRKVLAVLVVLGALGVVWLGYRETAAPSDPQPSPFDPLNTFIARMQAAFLVAE